MSDDTGYAIIPRWILKDDRFNANAILVYVALQSFAGPDGSAFPSIAVLAARARLGATATRAGVRSLEAHGIVVKHANFDHGLQSSNRYTILTNDPNPRDSRPSPGDAPPLATRGPAPRQARTELTPGTTTKEITPSNGAEREPMMSSPSQIEWLCDLHIHGGGTLSPGLKASFAAMTYDEADSEIQEALALLPRGKNYVGNADDTELTDKGRAVAARRMIPTKGTA